jgi:hypothetical protein
LPACLQRFSTGSLAHLLIFNTSLSPDNMLEVCG